MLLFKPQINEFPEFDITHNNNNIQSIDNSIIKELQFKLSELSSIIETHSTSIDKLIQNNISIQSTVDECNRISSSLQTECSSFQKQLPFITETLNKLDINELSSLNFEDIKYINNIKRNIVNINEDISSIKATILKQSKDQDIYNNNYQKIMSNIEDIANQIKVLKTKHDKDIQDMKMIIEQIKSDNTNHNDDLNVNALQTIERKLNEFNNRLLSNEESLLNIKHNIFDDEITKVLNEQQSLQKHIQILEKRMNDVNEISSLNKDKLISELQFNIKNIEKDIHNIKEDINDLKQVDDFDNDDNILDDHNNKNDLLVNDEQGGFITQTGMLRNETKNESTQNNNKQREMRTNILDLLNDVPDKETDMYQFGKDNKEEDEHNYFDDDDDDDDYDA